MQILTSIYNMAVRHCNSSVIKYTLQFYWVVKFKQHFYPEGKSL